VIKMTAIRKEIMNYINDIPDIKLEALRPILTLLADEIIIVETDLSNDEIAIVSEGREEYKRGNFVQLDLN